MQLSRQRRGRQLACRSRAKPVCALLPPQVRGARALPGPGDGERCQAGEHLAAVLGGPLLDPDFSALAQRGGIVRLSGAGRRLAGSDAPAPQRQGGGQERSGLLPRGRERGKTSAGQGEGLQGSIGLVAGRRRSSESLGWDEACPEKLR